MRAVGYPLHIVVIVVGTDHKFKALTLHAVAGTRIENIVAVTLQSLIAECSVITCRNAHYVTTTQHLGHSSRCGYVGFIEVAHIYPIEEI